MTNTINVHDKEYNELVQRFGSERVNRQLDLELEGQVLGQNRYLKKIAENRVNGKGADSGVAKGFLERSLPLVVSGLEEWFTKVNDGTPGKRHKAASIIKDVDVEVLAFVSLRKLMSDLLVTPCGKPLATIADSLGKTIESEIRFSKLLNSLPRKERSKVLEGLSKRVSLHFQTAFLRRVESHVAEDGSIGKWNPWTVIERTNVGIKMVELIAENTGLFYIESEKSGDNGYGTTNKVYISQDVVSMIDSRDIEIAATTSVNLPMVIEPKPWTDVLGGGYYMSVKRPLKLVRCPMRVLKNIYAHLDMPKVYKAVNAIQSTAWAVNKDVLNVAHEASLWRNADVVLDMPLKEPSEKPIRPHNATDEEHKNWKRDMVLWYQLDNKRKGRRFRVDSTLSLAEKYKEEAAIYFPHNVDFRGRVYPVTNLSPQGDDLMKSLLTFAVGKPIGDKGAYWLAYHGGNLYGLDKKPADERVAWVKDNTAMIQNIAENPLSDLRWTEADEPFQFLAFCFEWNKYMLSGEDKAFMSRLPIAFDGSCSGLQHFSAMLRDEVGGNAVNLVPHDTVQDVYSMVASKVLEQVEEDAVNGTGPTSTEKKDAKTGEVFVKHDAGTKAYASEWLEHGVSRSVVKRSVMTLAYGSKEYGFGDQILEDTVQPALEKNPESFKYPMKASRYMAKLVWNAVQGVVVKACEAMSWLQTAASALASATDDNGNSLPVTWVTPAGFPIAQRYLVSTIHKIDTVLNGHCRKMEGVLTSEPTRVVVHVAQATNELDKNRQRSGIAPNFVHSMDASHLMLTVCRCSDSGVKSFAMIHDSYGCTAGDAQTMYDTVREVFVDMYSDNNVLEDFREQCNNQLPEESQLNPIPAMGSLCLEDVCKSKYAFA